METPSRVGVVSIHPVYQTPSGLTSEVRAALSEQGNAILATISDDGSPHLTELLFLLDERDRIQLPTPNNTRKLKNLRARPIATVFFYDQPGWTSATGRVEIWTGERAKEANRRNRERVLTEAGHETIGRLLAEHEDSTIVVMPEKWLSWHGDEITPAIRALGGDVEKHPPETWFKDLKPSD